MLVSLVRFQSSAPTFARLAGELRLASRASVPQQRRLRAEAAQPRRRGGPAFSPRPPRGGEGRARQGKKKKPGPGATSAAALVKTRGRRGGPPARISASCGRG